MMVLSIVYDCAPVSRRDALRVCVLDTMDDDYYSTDAILASNQVSQLLYLNA